MGITLKRMGEILSAFNNKDLEAIVESFDEDGEFFLAAGTHPYGECFKGRNAIRTALAERFAAVPDIQCVDARSLDQRAGRNRVAPYRYRPQRPDQSAGVRPLDFPRG